MNKIREELDMLNGRIVALSKLKDDAVKKADTSHILADRIDAEKWEKALDELNQERSKRLEQYDIALHVLGDHLANIRGMTDCDSPGIYEPDNIVAINNEARRAFGMRETPADQWSHNQPKDPGAPQGTEGSRLLTACPAALTKLWAEDALKELSGDLSHDSVAAVKQILKKILDSASLLKETLLLAKKV